MPGKSRVGLSRCARPLLAAFAWAAVACGVEVGLSPSVGVQHLGQIEGGSRHP